MPVKRKCATGYNAIFRSEKGDIGPEKAIHGTQTLAVNGSAWPDSFLDLFEEKGLVSVAFHSIQTGAFGYPVEAVAPVAMEAVLETLARLDAVRRVRFVLFGEKNRLVYEKALAKALEKRGQNNPEEK